MQGESLRQICKDPKMPNKSTVCEWAMNENHEFSDQYALARRIQAELLMDEVFDIADNGTNDWMERLGQDGQSLGYQLNGEHVKRSRLRMDARRWYLSKVIPKLSDKKTLEHTGTVTVAAVEIQPVAPREYDEYEYEED